MNSKHKSEKKKKSKNKKEKKSKRSPSPASKRRETSPLPEIEDRDYCHNEAVSLFKKHLKSLITLDDLLSDLPKDVTLDEVKSQLALEYGQSMTITIQKNDGTSYNVIVGQSTTVSDLKKAIQRKSTLQLQREKKNVKISWKYVWKTYWLFFEGQKLKDLNKTLREYGITNNACVSFIKRLKEK